MAGAVDLHGSILLGFRPWSLKHSAIHAAVVERDAMTEAWEVAALHQSVVT
jgi:hypothetical protein